MLLNKISCPVLHHSTTPTFYEEIKIALPLKMTSQVRLLHYEAVFHVACALNVLFQHVLVHLVP